MWQAQALQSKEARQAAIWGKGQVGLPPTGSRHSNNTPKWAEFDEPMDYSRPAFASELPHDLLAQAVQRARHYDERLAAIAVEMPLHPHSGRAARAAQSSTPGRTELDEPLIYSQPALAKKKPETQRRGKPRQAAMPLQPQDALSPAASASTASLQPGDNASHEALSPSAPE